MLKSSLTAVVSAVCWIHLVAAGVLQPHQGRGSNVCSNGIYGELSILARYPPAVNYCANNFPVRCTSVGHKANRRGSPSTSNVLSVTTGPVDTTSSAFAKCLKQPASVISTLCSCIQTPKACPTSKTSKSTTKSATPSTTTSSAAPKPTACNSAQTAFCTRQTQNLCLCRFDVDGITPVCSNGAVCPQSTFPNPLAPCQSDADCSLYYPGSLYRRCVYTDAPSFCSPTFCATEENCNQQHARL